MDCIICGGNASVAIIKEDMRVAFCHEHAADTLKTEKLVACIIR